MRMRGALAPQVPHIPTIVSLGVLVTIDVLLLVVGPRKFNGKAIG
jgi:hypothetical protein